MNPLTLNIIFSRRLCYSIDSVALVDSTSWNHDIPLRCCHKMLLQCCKSFHGHANKAHCCCCCWQRLSVPGAKATDDTLTTNETQELGKVFNLGKTTGELKNLLEDVKEIETSIFEAFPSECVRKKMNSKRNRFECNESAKTFYSKLATQAGLDTSLQPAYSLSTSLNSVTGSTSSSESKVNGISLIVD